VKKLGLHVRFWCRIISEDYFFPQILKLIFFANIKNTEEFWFWNKRHRSSWCKPCWIQFRFPVRKRNLGPKKTAAISKSRSPLSARRMESGANRGSPNDCSILFPITYWLQQARRLSPSLSQKSRQGAILFQIWVTMHNKSGLRHLLTTETAVLSLLLWSCCLK